MKRYTVALLFLIGCVASCSQPIEENQHLVENLMRADPDKFQYYIDHQDSLEIQVIYTQINRDKNNVPSFKSFYFNVDSTKYFYPASTVKLPLVLLALEKLKTLNVTGLDKNTPMLSDSVYSGQQTAHRDSTSENGLPSIAQYAKKILLVSDNDGYNRLYEFMGQKEINQILNDKGYNIKILHRLERPLSPDQNRHTEAITFVKDNVTLYQQPMLVNPDSIRPSRQVLKGKGYIRNEELVRAPFDFTYKNSYPLAEQQEILKAILFPNSVDERKRFNMSEEDRQFVLKYMSQWPRETQYPAYSRDSLYNDAYCKFLMVAQDKGRMKTNIRIFNKIGNAYGYLIDNAYIVDFNRGIEFMLTAVIHVNQDGVYNDGKYEYDSLGYPFMKYLGQAVYEFERDRKKSAMPDLSAFKLTYD